SRRPPAWRVDRAGRLVAGRAPRRRDDRPRRRGPRADPRRRHPEASGRLAAGGPVSQETLGGALPDTETYRVALQQDGKKIEYAAEFVEEGLRVTRQNPELSPRDDQQVWLRSLTVTEAPEVTS